MLPRFWTMNNRPVPSPAFWISTGRSRPETTGVHTKAAGSGKPLRKGELVGALVGARVGVTEGTKVGTCVGAMVETGDNWGWVGEGCNGVGSPAQAERIKIRTPPTTLSRTWVQWKVGLFFIACFSVDDLTGLILLMRLAPGPADHLIYRIGMFLDDIIRA